MAAVARHVLRVRGGRVAVPREEVQRAFVLTCELQEGVEEIIKVLLAIREASTRQPVRLGVETAGRVAADLQFREARLQIFGGYVVQTEIVLH